MKKRSAMLLAAGLVLALLAAGTIVSFSLSGATAAAGDATEPLVLTQRRTVTIHRDAGSDPARVVDLSAVSASRSADDEGFEGEYESEHESGDGSEDRSEDGDSGDDGSENSGPGSSDDDD